MIVSEITCPKCGSEECGETSEGREVLLIRGLKVMDDNGYWWSKCLVCSGNYPDFPNLDNFINSENRKQFWF